MNGMRVINIIIIIIYTGTQIEEAKTYTSTSGFHYTDYSPNSPDWYLSRTSYWGARLDEETL